MRFAFTARTAGVTTTNRETDSHHATRAKIHVTSVFLSLSRPPRKVALFLDWVVAFRLRDAVSGRGVFDE